MIEANHDINMLMTGPYPYPLKQRILGLRGHLSNEACGRLLGELISDRTEHIVLGHLSHENNFLTWHMRRSEWKLILAIMLLRQKILIFRWHAATCLQI